MYKSTKCLADKVENLGKTEQDHGPVDEKTSQLIQLAAIAISWVGDVIKKEVILVYKS